jgi:hypothetical protein
MFWQDDIEKWVKKHKKVSNDLNSSFIRFFELAFENTRCPEQSWFGVHNHAISLVIGGIFLAAVNLPYPDYGIWLLLDKSFVATEKIEFTPVRSTINSITPLTWGHIKIIENIKVLFNDAEIWHSYSEASEKILNAPISKSRDAEFQKRRRKQRLVDFWNTQFLLNFDSPELRIEQQRIEDEGYFNVENLEDARRRVTSSIVQRQGQAEFRRKLLNAYNGCCPITGCDVETAIEAAHIIPYLGAKTNHITNGLPLRADIHTLFDLHLLSINPNTYEVVINPDLSISCYQGLAGCKLTLPKNSLAFPDKSAVAKHYEQFLQKCANR